MNENTKIKKTLKFYDVFFISLGYIIGAGIYSLIYLITKYGKQYTWLSFLIGGLISLATGLSYSNLAKYFDNSASEYDYITKLISSRFKYITFIILLLFGIFTTSTLVLAFSNLTKKMYPKLSYNLILVLTILIPSIINILNIKMTSNINIIVTLIETVILLCVIFIGYKYGKMKTIINPINIYKTLKYTNIFEKSNLKGIFYGSFLSIFAYSGFEGIPKLANDTLNSKEIIPKAIISSILVVIILYILVSLSLNSILGYKKVGDIINPLSIALGNIFGKNTKTIINYAALFSIFNTILICILFTSRQLYDIVIQKDFKLINSDIIGKINKKTNTPINAIILVVILTLLLSLHKNITHIGFITNFILFILFTLVNLANIILYFKNKNKNKNSYFPIYSIIGFISSIYMIYLSFVI